MNSKYNNDSNLCAKSEIKEKKQDTIATIKVLEERVNNYKEMFDNKLSSIKQLYGTVIIILTLIGIGTIATIIVNIVKNTAEATLESILTPEYIEKKILEKSDPVLEKIVDDIETKVTNKVRENLSYAELKALAGEETLLKDYENGIILYKKAKEKLTAIGSHVINFQEELLNLTVSMAEVEIILKKYMDASDTLEECRPEGDNKSYIALYYFHKCIIEKVLKREAFLQSEKNLDAILQKDNFKLTIWYFDSLKEWLSSAQLPEDDVKYIKALIEKMEISQSR